MQLDGIHHISCITGDAARNLDFYTRVMGLRLVTKTVNQDDPYVYHLFYADYHGSPGADLTFFEYPGALPGRAGAGMIHRIVFRVGSVTALDFWAARLGAEGLTSARDGERLRFNDPEGLGLELMVYHGPDAPLMGRHPEIPAAMALLGFDAVRGYAGRPAATRRVVEEVLGGRQVAEDQWEIAGASRHGTLIWDRPPIEPGRSGAGTVHHVAWSTEMAEHHAWRDRLHQAGISSTPVIDRYYFLAIYFREPGGVLFELSSKGPGFAADVPLESLGDELVLPPKLEPRRAEIEAHLTPLEIR